MKSSLLFTDTLERKIKKVIVELKQTKIHLYLHPFVYAYVNQGLLSMKKKWKMQYGFGLKITPDQSLGMLQYRFTDKNGDEIDMKEEHDMK